jgi:cytochrome c-type biogenesis protein CcmH
MSAFWAIGAALAAGALFLVLRPLWRQGAGARVSRREANIAIYRDQRRELDADLAAGKLAPADHERSCAELEARLLEDVDAAPEAPPAPSAGRPFAVALGVAVPACALALYLMVGNPGGVVPGPAQGKVTQEQIEAMVAGLAARLRENPQDTEGWKMLGRSYAVLGRFPDAVAAYAKAAERAPRDAPLLADFADVLAMSRGGSLEGEPEKLIQRALEIEPTNLKALALAGTAAYDRKDFEVAAGYWQRMLPLVAADSEDARVIRSNVDEARKLAGIGAEPAGATGAPAAPAPAAAAAPGVRGRVRVADGLKGKFGPDDTLFIYARAAGGPPMPLAVLRRRARELPLEFALDDSMAMAPGMALSAHPRVVITARISRTGNAIPQPGDLTGASPQVANDAQGVNVVVDTIVK